MKITQWLLDNPDAPWSGRERFDPCDVLSLSGFDRILEFTSDLTTDAEELVLAAWTNDAKAEYMFGDTEVDAGTYTQVTGLMLLAGLENSYFRIVPMSAELKEALKEEMEAKLPRDCGDTWSQEQAIRTSHFSI